MEVDPYAFLTCALKGGKKSASLLHSLKNIKQIVWNCGTVEIFGNDGINSKSDLGGN
jgi:hypothetical protein